MRWTEHLIAALRRFYEITGVWFEPPLNSLKLSTSVGRYRAFGPKSYSSTGFSVNKQDPRPRSEQACNAVLRMHRGQHWLIHIGPRTRRR